MTPANDNSARPASFDAAVLQWRPFLHKMARHLSPLSPEDLVQETIATALHRWASYREGCSLPGWLVFQMRERCQEMRKRREARPMPQASTPATQEDHAGAMQALALVAPKYRGLIALTAAGYEQQEIADIEGVSRQAIHQRLAKARRGLGRAG